MNNKFIIGDISQKLTQTINDIIEELNTNNSDYIKILENFKIKIEELLNSKVLKIAFVGQYSAGKSTMISALTNNRAIKIDADIATDTTCDYQWNNIILTDAPGLYTDRKDHDQITLSAIKEADLLVFCLTSDLFDNIILNNFIELAYTRGYKNKMIIVINKMSMESGNYADLVDNYIKTLSTSLTPYNFNDFPSSFIDAADYIESIDSKNEKLRQLSHFEDFINSLNEFVSKKGITGKLDTPIRFAISTINDMIVDIEGREDKEFIQSLSRLEYAIRKNKESTDSKIKIIINEIVIDVIKQSNKITTKLGEEKVDIDLEMKIIQTDIEKVVEKRQKEVADILEEQNKILTNDIQDILESELMSFVFNSIEVGKLKLDKDVSNNLGEFINNFKFIKTTGNGISKFVTEQAKINGSQAFGTASQVAGSNLHNVIFSVGKFFGVKFKPWEAVNMAKNLGNVAKAAGPILSIIGLGIEIASFYKSSENVNKLINAKKEIYDQFLSVANNIENAFIQNYEEYKRQSYMVLINKISEIKEKQLNDRKKANKISKYLEEKKQELEELLNILYK